MGILIHDLSVGDPCIDIEKYTGKSYCWIEIISGNRKGESAHIETNKVYDVLMNLFDKEI
jgi:hypothetical protein